MEFTLTQAQLRPWTAADLPALLLALKQPSVHQNLRPPPPQVPCRLTPRHFAIVCKDQTIGGIGFDPTEDPNALEIGFWLLESASRQGIMSEAVTTLTAHALQSGTYQSIRARVYDQHPASTRVLEKSGYQLIAQLPQGVSYGGKSVDVKIYEAIAQ